MNERISVYGLEIFMASDGIRIYDGDRRLYPYRKKFMGCYCEWVRWDDATPAALKRALYAKTACVAGHYIYDYWKTANATRRGRFLYR